MESCRGGCLNYRPERKTCSLLLPNSLAGFSGPGWTIIVTSPGHHIIECCPKTSQTTSLTIPGAYAQSRAALHPPKRLLHPPRGNPH